jgi:acetylornithine/succinyldiaminopimelate/putrescine aminotransferase
MTKGEGSYVTFEDGRKMLDFSCGIGVTNLGEFAMCSTVNHSLEVP